MALTALQVAAAAYIGGFSGNDVVEAVKVAYGESSWNPQAKNSCCYGLWQINANAHKDLMKKYKWDNPADNARMANIIFQKGAGILHPMGGWCTSGKPPSGCNPWQAYGNSNYKSKDAEAKAAWAELKSRIGKGEKPEAILGSSRSDGATGEPNLGGLNGPGPLNVIGPIIDAFNRMGHWITNPDNLARILKVVMGGAVILVGGAIVLNKQITDVIPAGRIAKKVIGK